MHVRFLEHGEQRMSARRPVCSSDRMYVQGRTWGIASSTVATPVFPHAFRCRSDSRLPVHSCRSAPIRSAASVFISDWESTRMPSGRRAHPAPRGTANERRQIHAGFPIASTPPCVREGARTRDGGSCCLYCQPSCVVTTSRNSNASVKPVRRRNLEPTLVPDATRKSRRCHRVATPVNTESTVVTATLYRP